MWAGEASEKGPLALKIPSSVPASIYSMTRGSKTPCSCINLRQCHDYHVLERRVFTYPLNRSVRHGLRQGLDSTIHSTYGGTASASAEFNASFYGGHSEAIW
ncbi:hypothetical protein NC653_021706 [Populus alba x Populus x berolinensis]|uniref:Uncharacterized protein n=1 Tax=Populus alba x Populus x berolinensis TaxID=444605 RepID=A0AAD6QE41_9ROSI|nr:hypothetical protein NC653_021706 [Populus alba x Populus x berolinensis]